MKSLEIHDQQASTLITAVKKLEERDLELSNLKVEHARLKDGVKELINCVAWYATSLNWMRRLDAKDNDKPAEAHTVKWKRAQECLELVNKLLKG